MKNTDRIPPVDGPTLGSFKYSLEDRIEILGLLSDPEGEESVSSSSGGGHAHVFKARIGKKVYAVKIFKFVEVQELRGMTITQNHFVDDKTLRYHSDPFFAECRAYGKIEEIQQRRKEKQKGRHWRRMPSPIAVRCFGYLEIPAYPYEDEMREKFGVTTWDRPIWELERPVEDRRAFQAIVKQLVTDTRAIRLPSRMLDHLELLRAAGVYPQDTCARNYKGGLIVDFSSAWTVPHWSLQYLEEPALSMRRDVDLRLFDKMMKELRITSVRKADMSQEQPEQVKPKKRKVYQQSEETIMKLRARSHRQLRS